jgi:N-acetylneuraminate lyase
MDDDSNMKTRAPLADRSTANASSNDFLPLTGLIAAPFTPMNDDGGLDLARIPEIARLLHAEGLSGVFICGTTGEGASLTTEERLRVAEAWMECPHGDLRVVVNTGHAGLADARILARHAESIGAGGIGILPPYFFKPQNTEELLACCEDVCRACPKTPAWYYHIPSLTGVFLPIAPLLRAARGRIPNLVGVKYTHHDLADYQRCLSLGGFDAVFGRDELLLASLAVGARGAIGSTYNYAAPIYLEIMEAFAKGDLARAQNLQQRSVRLVEILERHGGGVRFGKAMMKLRGVDCGPVRLPLTRVGEDELGDIKREWDALERGLVGGS